MTGGARDWDRRNQKAKPMKNSSKSRKLASLERQQLHQWKGMPCEILNRQSVLTSHNQERQCAAIRVIGLQLYQGLRLVPVEELTLWTR